MKTPQCMMPALTLLATTAAAVAQVPELINYQGRLLDGTNLVNDTVPIVFRVYDEVSGGNPHYAETQTVAVIDGLFATRLGASNPVPGSLHAVLTNAQVYVELEVDGTVLSPREQMVSVPYARMADTADTYAETDPVFRGSAAAAITHAGDGIVMSGAERMKLAGIEPDADVTDAANISAAGAAMDDDFPSEGLLKRGAVSGSYSIVSDNSASWNDAHGWGDHAAQGYLKHDGSLAMTGDLNMGGNSITNISPASLAYSDGLTVGEKFVDAAGDTMSGTLMVDGDVRVSGGLFLGPAAGQSLLSFDTNGHFLGVTMGEEAIDQSQESYNVNLGSVNVWQSFTAGASAKLLKVGLYLASNDASGTLHIRSGEGAGGALLYAKPISWSGPGWHEETIDEEVVLTSGQQYTIHLALAGNRSFRADNTDPYGSGRAHSLPSDLMFRTYAFTLQDLALVVREGGNIGIGTGSPWEKLTVQGNVAAGTFIGDGSGLTGIPSGSISLSGHSVTELDDVSDPGSGQIITAAERVRLSATITNGAVAGGDLAGTYPDPEIGSDAVGSAEIIDDSIQEGDVAPNTFWATGGNAGTTAGTHFVGTTDGQPLDFHVDSQRALRLEPGAGVPNVVGGHGGNLVSNGVSGATIAGGAGNIAGQETAVVGGGTNNLAGGISSVVGGGRENRATAYYSTVPGGVFNLAGASGSFAAGNRAKATNIGAFVWSDYHAADFGSTAPHQFLIRASGGVGIGTNVTPEALTVAGNVKADGFLGDGSGLTDIPSGSITLTGHSVTELDDVGDAGSGEIITDVERSKLADIEDNADVTDAANISAAGAAMDGDFASEGLMRRGAAAGSYSIVNDQSADWNTAYGWGNHGAAGYLIRDGSLAMTGNLDMGGYAVSNGVFTGDGSGLVNLSISLAGHGVAELDDVGDAGSGEIITDVERSKLADIEDNADVTDAANISAAGAAMDGDFASEGLMRRGAAAGSYSIVNDQSADWNTAYGWGNHGAAGYLKQDGSLPMTGHLDMDGHTVGSGVFTGDGSGLSFERVQAPGGALVHVDSDVQGDSAGDVWTAGGLVFVANGDGGVQSYAADAEGLLTFLDADDPGHSAFGIWSDGAFVYVANYSGGLLSYAVDAGGNLTLVDTNGTSTLAYDVWGDGTFLYVADAGKRVYVYSVDGAGNLTLLASNTTAGSARRVWGDGTFLYVAEHSTGVRSYSVDGNGDLTNLDGENTGGNAYGVWGDGAYVYVAAGSGGLRSYAVDAGGQFTLIDSHNPGDSATAVWGDGVYLYLANADGGLHTYAVSAGGVLTPLEFDDPGGVAYSAWGDGKFVYLANGVGGLHAYRSPVTIVELDADRIGIGTERPSARLEVAGTVRAASFSGDGSGLAGLHGGNISAATVGEAQLADGAVTAGKLAGDAVTGASIADGEVANADLAPDAVTAAKIADGAIGSADVAGNTFWETDGNAGTTAGVHFLGTTDDEPFEIHVNGQRAVRISREGVIPNIVAGRFENAVTTGVYGAVIAGGGGIGNPNLVTDHYGSIGGGIGNVAGDGNGHTGDARMATVGGGHDNRARGDGATVAGGYENTADVAGAAVGGGYQNAALGLVSTVAGGYTNVAAGDYAAVPGGRDNRAAGTDSLAAGRRAKALHDGAFVWADATDADFSSTADDQFIVRATGGVGIGTNDPPEMLTVAGNVQASAFMGDGSQLTGIGSSGIGAGAISNHHLAADAVTGDKIADGAVAAADVAGNTFWETGGNAGTTAGTHYLGTFDNEPLELHVGGQRGWRLEPTAGAPNLVGGASNNAVSNGVLGAAVAGGEDNVVGGHYAAIGGGAGNRAPGDYGAVPGGRDNTASGDYSLAAGQRAQAAHQGSFVWADSAAADFSSTVDDQFLVRASGGVGIGTNATPEMLTVSGNVAPGISDQFSLGTGSLRWQELYLASEINYGDDLAFVSGSTTSLLMDAEGGLVLSGDIDAPEGITIQSTSSNVLIVAGPTRITVDPSGGVTIESTTNVTVAAEGDLDLSGRNVNISAANDLLMSASNLVDCTAGYGFSLMATNDRPGHVAGGLRVDPDNHLVLSATNSVTTEWAMMTIHTDGDGVELTSSGDCSIDATTDLNLVADTALHIATDTIDLDESAVTLNVEDLTLAGDNFDADMTEDFRLDADFGVEITAKRDIKLTATQNIELTATQNIDAQATMNATLKAGLNGKLESSNTVDINGGAMVRVVGGLINLN